MSTRCNVIIKDNSDKLYFYRHSDGYPEGVAETLNAFMDRLKSGEIRNNVSQSAGWLIILGHEEYAENRKLYPEHSSWKVGAYEPTTALHGDIEFLYEIDLKAKTLKGWEHDGEKKGKPIKIPRSE